MRCILMPMENLTAIGTLAPDANEAKKLAFLLGLHSIRFMNSEDHQCKGIRSAECRNNKKDFARNAQICIYLTHWVLLCCFVVTSDLHGQGTNNATQWDCIISGSRNGLGLL